VVVILQLIYYYYYVQNYQKSIVLIQSRESDKASKQIAQIDKAKISCCDVGRQASCIRKAGP
jgi:hypothetical protein